MSSSKSFSQIIICLLIIIIAFLLGFYFYPQMPPEMASHWNTQGEVNGYLSKFWALFLLPFLMVILFLLFLIIPEIDPLKKNIEKFRKFYDEFALLIIFFLFYIYVLTILWGLGLKFRINLFLAPLLAVLFYYLGVLMSKAKRNWFIGIRTPWTLSNEKVWQKTHQLGSKLFKCFAFFIIFSLFFKEGIFVWAILTYLAVTVLYLTVYSYFLFQKLK